VQVKVLNRFEHLTIYTSMYNQPDGVCVILAVVFLSFSMKMLG